MLLHSLLHPTKNLAHIRCEQRHKAQKGQRPFERTSDHLQGEGCKPESIIPTLYEWSGLEPQAHYA